MVVVATMKATAIDQIGLTDPTSGVNSRKRGNNRQILLRDFERQVGDLIFCIHDRANPLHWKAPILQQQAAVTTWKGKTKGSVVRIRDTQGLRNNIKHRVLDAG